MKELWKGNEAIGEAAVRAGLDLYVGYPITPQSEICEYMSDRMRELGRAFIQSESEIISINTAIGGALAGGRSMTSSSGVGTSLMQEGTSDAFAKGLPLLLVNVNRYGCGMGCDFGGGTDDYLRDTRGGGNGDYRFIVYIPATVQEAVDLTYNAFDVGEKYRNPVEIMTEGRLGQLMESVEMPEFKKGTKAEWVIDGTTKPMPDYPPIIDNSERYKAKMDAIRENEQRWESYRTEDAETILVSIGLCSRIARAVVDEKREQGEKIGLLRPITVWPYPEKAFEELSECVKRIVCMEITNDGQMLEDVLIATKKIKKLQNIPVYEFNRTRLMYADRTEMSKFIEGILDGSVKEV